jgi:hypothetical protein
MDNTKKENLKIVLEVKAINFNNQGQLLDAISAGAKLTKADAGRISQNDEDTITILGSDCGNPVITADYRSTSLGKGETKTNLELDLKGQVYSKEKNQLVDGFSANSKLEKLDDGLDPNKKTEDWHRLKAEKDCKAGCANVESHYSTKTTEIAK